MPVFEYTCKSCGKAFERVVFRGEEDKISCPECKSRDVVKTLAASSFMGSSIGTCSIPFPKGAS